MAKPPTKWNTAEKPLKKKLPRTGRPQKKNCRKTDRITPAAKSGTTGPALAYGAIKNRPRPTAGRERLLRIRSVSSSFDCYPLRFFLL